MAKRTHQSAAPVPQKPVEVIDPRWLIKAFVLTLLVALLCSYITLCVLFYQGQWQFALHPSHTVAQTPASLGLRFEAVSFDVDSTGKPQLSGWFIPSDSHNAPTVLVLHGGDGSISDALPSVQVLHTARLGVLLFDYRGYGASTGPHPTQLMMEADSDAALTYLTSTRGITLDHILPFGQGIGAALATRLCVQHHELPALLLDSPQGDIDASVAHDSRSAFIPTRLLLHEHFPLADPLSKLTTPKFIVTSNPGASPLNPHRAADPKMTIEFPHKDDIAYVLALTRFLDLYVPNQQPSPLTPHP